MKARLIYACGCRPTAEFPSGVKPAGTIIEHPDVYKLVRRGCAEPADEEGSKAANISKEKWEEAVQHYARTSAGIHPDDFAAWDRGLMRGYNPDGSWVPGPNFEDDEDIDLVEEDELYE